MKELWNRLIINYRENRKINLENKNEYAQRLARDEMRKIEKIFKKTFDRDIKTCDLLD